MANIVNGGAILLVAAFGLAAIVGGVEEFRDLSASRSRLADPEPDVTPPHGPDPSGVLDDPAPLPGDRVRRDLHDERDDPRHEGKGERDRDDDRGGDDDRRGGKGDKDEKDEDEKEEGGGGKDEDEKDEDDKDEDEDDDHDEDDG